MSLFNGALPGFHWVTPQADWLYYRVIVASIKFTLALKTSKCCVLCFFSFWVSGKSINQLRHKSHIMRNRCGFGYFCATENRNVLTCSSLFSCSSRFLNPLSASALVCPVAGCAEGSTQGNVRRPRVWILPVPWRHPLRLGPHLSHQTARQKPAPVWI